MLHFLDAQLAVEFLLPLLPVKIAAYTAAGVAYPSGGLGAYVTLGRGVCVPGNIVGRLHPSGSMERWR